MIAADAVTLVIEDLNLFAGHSAQLLPWLCQPVSIFVARVSVSDVTTNADVSQHVATTGRLATGLTNTLLRKP